MWEKFVKKVMRTNIWYDSKNTDRVIQDIFKRIIQIESNPTPSLYTKQEIDNLIQSRVDSKVQLRFNRHKEELDTLSRISVTEINSVGDKAEELSKKLDAIIKYFNLELEKEDYIEKFIKGHNFETGEAKYTTPEIKWRYKVNIPTLKKLKK